MKRFLPILLAALSLRAQVQSAELNGKPISFNSQVNSSDQHVSVNFPACTGANKLVLHFRNDFQLGLNSALPPLGAKSEGIRVISQTWSPTRDALTLEASGISDHRYDLAILDPSQIASVDGGVEAAPSHPVAANG